MTSSPVEINPWVPHRRELRGVKGNIIQLRYRRSLGTVRASHHRGIAALRKRIDEVTLKYCRRFKQDLRHGTTKSSARETRLICGKMSARFIAQFEPLAPACERGP